MNENNGDKAAGKSFRSPFKDAAVMDNEIISFINKYKATVTEHGKRMSDYFEMSCFNLIVKYYVNSGYEVQIANLKQGKFRYKCSPAGIQSNFSHFEASITYGAMTYYFEIHHNLPVQSSHDETIVATPDISVIKKGAVKYRNDYYDTKKTLSYVENPNMLTFCEVKHFAPFPELIFNFMGVVNELRGEILDNSEENLWPKHIAPSLMISGKSTKPTDNIKASLEGRYVINILFDLFYSGRSAFWKSGVSSLQTAGWLDLPDDWMVNIPEGIDDDPF